jgi:hypothetical protein
VAATVVVGVCVVGVEGSDGCGGAMGGFSRFSAFVIGSNSYGLWRHCRHGERWFPCSGVPSFLMLCCVRGGPLPYKTSAPDQGVD